MKTETYASYQASDIDWVGEIPLEWGVKPAFALVRESKVPNAGTVETNVLSLSYGRIVRRDVERLFGLLPESFETYQIVEPGSVVLRLTDLQNDQRSFRVGYVDQRGIITSAYLNLVPNGRLIPRYLYYLLHYYDLRKVFYGMGSGVRQSMGYTDLRRMPIILPSAPEQQAIADFLNRETAKIDTLIEKQERLIELLEEKRQAEVTRAVTKGLNPDVRMKDSGVEWLGEVPEHWEVDRVKRLFENLDHQRIPLSAEERSARHGDYPYYGASGVIDYIDDFIYDEDLVLVGEDGANLVLRSTPVAFVATGKYWVNNHAHILRPKDGLPEFWAHCLNQIDLRPFVSGSAQPKLTAEALGGLPIAFPPLMEERRRIIQSISTAMQEIRNADVASRAMITLLRERRTALISAAVTGKIDVRQAV